MGNRMNILIVTNMYPSNKKPYWGSFVKVQALELERAGHNVTVVSDVQTENVLLKYLSIFIRTFYWGLKSKPDIIHVHYIYPTSLGAIILKKLINCPLVITSHRCDAFDMPFRNKINLALTKLCIRNADLVVAVSKEIKKKIYSDLDGSKTRISVLDMGVRPPKVEFSCDNPEDKTRNKILFIGLSFERKGGYELLDAINQIIHKMDSDFSVTFVGEFPDDAKIFVRKNHLEKVVSSVGRLPHDEIPRLISRHEIFVLASYSEGLPIAMLEAMAHGLCVIATPVGDIGSVLSDGSGIIIPFGDSKALADSLVDLMTNEGKKAQMSKLAIQKSAKFSSSDRAHKLVELYKTLLN